MSNKQLKFSVFQLIIEGKPFTADSFAKIDETVTETVDVNTSKTETEILSIKKVEKKIFGDKNRFVSLYINQGDKFPYSPIVVDSGDMNIKENPRSSKFIEMGDQFFALIDVENQRVYLSDQRQKAVFSSWLQLKIEKMVTIKSIINEGSFLEKMESVNKLTLTVVPNLFNSIPAGTLSSHLVQDMYGFGAEKIKIEFDYCGRKMTDKIKDIIADVIGQKVGFKEIAVIGKTDDGLEGFFNLEEVISKITIDVPAHAETNLFESDVVFSSLADRIK